MWIEKVTALDVSGIGIASSGVLFGDAGNEAIEVTIRKMALAAIAPLKPATNDVHPVRKPASGPNASRR